MYYVQKKNTGLAYTNTFRFLTYLDEKRFNREDDKIRTFITSFLELIAATNFAM